MRRSALSVGGWIAAACVIGSALWACGSDETSPFSEPATGGQTTTGGTDAGDGGTSGTSSGGANGGSATGGTSGSSSGGVETGGTSTGGMSTGGTTGDGGAAAESGSDTGGSTTGGDAGTSGAGAGMGGNAGTPPVGGAGMGGAAGARAGAGGAGMGGAAGSGGNPGDCKSDTDCADSEYCKKMVCDAEWGFCTARGPECRDEDAVFDPVCGCDGITYWNACTIEHEGFNIEFVGECTGNNRPTCTMQGGGDSCPERIHAHCYRTVDICGIGEPPETGFCWVLPAECPDDEPQTERYCGGTAGGARCIGLCEVIEAENSFRRDSPMCD